MGTSQGFFAGRVARGHRRPALNVILAASLTASLAGSGAAAQGVRGTVTGPGGGPVGPAAVTLIDSAGGVVATALSDSLGHYTSRRVAPGRYRVRALRIGMAPATAGPITIVADQVVALDLRFPREVVLLASVDTRVARRCTVDPDDAELAGAMLEAAHAALAATTIAPPRVGDFRLWHVQRVLSPDGARVRDETEWEDSLPPRELYRSFPAESLAVHGFVVPYGDSTVFYAPDATTLLSAAFARSHCYRAIAASTGDSTHAHDLGLAFQPLHGSALPDVRGVLWLDATTLALHSLDYGYTALPSWITAAAARGHVEYAALPSGAWVVKRWSIRMPYRVPVEERRSDWRGRRSAGAFVISDVALDGASAIIEQGGALLAPGEHVAPRPGIGVIGGLVLDSTGAPWRGGRVTLVGPGADSGLAAAALTDATGAFVFPTLATGEYHVVVTDTSLASVYAGILATPIVLRPDQRIDVTIKVGVDVDEACPATTASGARVQPMQLRVVDSVSNLPVPYARLRIRAETGARGDAPLDVDARTDAAGRAMLCGIPDGARVTLSGSARARAIVPRLLARAGDGSVLVVRAVGAAAGPVRTAAR